MATVTYVRLLGVVCTGGAVCRGSACMLVRLQLPGCAPWLFRGSEKRQACLLLAEARACTVFVAFVAFDLCAQGGKGRQGVGGLAYPPHTCTQHTCAHTHTHAFAQTCPHTCGLCKVCINFGLTQLEPQLKWVMHSRFACTRAALVHAAAPARVCG